MAKNKPKRVFANYRDMYYFSGKPFWRNCYAVDIGNGEILVNADNEEDALDYAIDCAEKRGWKGLFLAPAEIEELEKDGHLNEHECGGNHSLYLAALSCDVSVRLIKQPLRIQSA